MAASLLEENLRSLHQYVVDADTVSKDQAVNVISDIQQLCVNEVTEKDIDLCCSALFDKDKGIITFLNKTVTNDEWQLCKQRILELLSEFIQKVGKKILPYAVDIKDICISLFFRDRFAKVKNSSMSALIKLMELTVGSTVGKDLEIDKIIVKFFGELSKPSSKVSATVRESIYILLGVIAEIYPENMMVYSERLIGLYVVGLKTEMTSKTRKPELSVIAGCLEGLGSCLVNFTQSADEGSKHSYEIFKYARMAIDPKIQYTRYDVPRAGLRLFSRHAGQFNLYLIDDYEGMYEKLKYWSRHNNRDLLHLGMSAIDAFLSQISEMLVERAKEGKKEGAIFKYFIHQFRELMNDTNTGSKELSLAIRGYGLLAAPCRTFLKPADVQFMFSEMMTKSEQQFLGQTENLDDKLYNLPSYLEALANIVKEIDEISETYATSLERLIVLLIERIPNIHHTQHFFCLKAVLSVLLSLMPKGSTFQQVLSGVVFQGLIRTCSHPPVIETEQTELDVIAEPEASIRKITYKDYLELWSGLLESARIKAFAVADISIDIRHRLTEALYDELITSVLKILSKLDLSSLSSSDLSAQMDDGTIPSTSTDTTENNADATADPLSGIQAKKPKDFQVFINLVDFCRDLLPDKHYNMFKRWIFSFSHTIILKSTDNPLVSGFYKLLAVSMKIANKLNYFQSMTTTPVTPVKKEEKMDIDLEKPECNQQKAICYLLMKKFSKEVLVRMKQYRDDLLASCLNFILALPKEIIAEQMYDVVPAIQVTLTIGLSYLPLAVVALDALEYWSDTLPQSIIKPHYCKILPYLDSYLRTADKASEEVSVDNTLNITASKTGKGRKKVAVRLVKGKNSKQTEQNTQSQLSQVKDRVMKYLGSLGGSLNHELLANTNEEISKQAIAWDNHKHLKFDMPFVDLKPTIYFDSFLPHIVQLATKSSDRQTKVAACELLHSLILFCLGRGANRPGQKQERFSMSPIYKKLFPSILELACDVELVCKQLFEPLVMQIVHWFTSNKKAESEETMALLDAIYDGIIQPSNTALRDFCAQCLREFLKWSIKQTSKQTLEKSPINVKSVLKRLFSYSLHPSAFKRLGAALAFNNIYVVFREENTLVDMFTFQILVHFVESLAIAHRDEKSLGTQEQCSKALDHLERIIREKAALLRKPSKQRTEPKQWSQIQLDIGVRWLMRQCGRPQTECRHACMKLFYKLSPLIQGITSPQSFCQVFLKSQKQMFFISRFEDGGHSGSGHGISGSPTLDMVSDMFTMSSAIEWFDMLLAALDCYCWMFQEKLLSPSDLFSGTGGKKTKIFESVQYFIENIALSDINKVSKLFTVKLESDYFTPREIEEFNRVKCTVLIRLLNFLTVMLASYQKEAIKVIPEGIWCSSLWKLICTVVVQPESVGFNMGDIEIMMNLPQEMEQVVVVMTKILPGNLCENMKKSFKDVLQGDRDIIGHLPVKLTDPGLDSVRFQQLLRGYGLLYRAGILVSCINVKSITDLSNQLFNNVYQGIIEESSSHVSAITITPTIHIVAKEILDLSFLLGLKSQVLIEAILDTKMVGGSGKGLEQSHGDLLFSSFKSSISTHLATTAALSVPVLSGQASTKGRKVSSILVTMVDHVTRDKVIRKRDGNNVVSAVLAEWHKFSCWWVDKSATDLQSMALLLLTKLLLIDGKFTSTPSHPAFDHVFEMYQKLLTDSRTNLAFKCRVLEVLPFFSTVPQSHAIKLKGSLDRMVADNFPLKSSEFPTGSPQYRDYTTALDRILLALELSGSLMLLELVISIFCRENKHALEDDMMKSLSRFTKRLPADKQKLAVDVAYKVFEKEGSFPADIRRATIEKVALQMLRLVQKSALIEFFLDHIGEIRSTVEAKLVKTPESTMENHLVSKMCCFQLLEVMYSRLSKDEVLSKSSIINEKFCQAKGAKVDTGKEMTQLIMRSAHDAKGEDVRGETILVPLRRQYHCAAYNLLISILSCTQTDPKFYAVFLFKEDEAKGQFVLDNVIDKDKVYEFPVELQSPLARRKKFVSIRTEVKERYDDENAMEYSPSYNLASEYLVDSSLNEDLNQYDFSASSTAQFMSGQPNRERSRSRSERITEIDQDEEGKRQRTQVTVEGDYVELEMDELNEHECMAAMISLLNHMQRTGISPEVPPGTGTPEMPVWMKYLHDKLKNPKTHNNVKLFIAKLIINTAEIFRPYAKNWFRPLCQLIFSGPFVGGINYYIIDVVVTMMSWHKVAIPQDSAEEKAMATRLVEYLTGNIYHETRMVFRNNLEMLKTLLQCWKDRVEIPYNIIYNHLKSTDAKAKESVGIQIMGVVMACKFPPYGPVAPVDRDRYFQVVARHMDHHYKSVYAASAEVVGMILKFLSEKEKQTEGPFHDHVNSMMSSIHTTKPDTFVTDVHRMHRHYPPIADRFLNKFLFMLPNLHGEFRTLCLEVLLSRIDQIDNVFLEMKSKGLLSYITHRDEGTQLVSLKIVQAISAKLKPTEIKEFMPLVTAISSHPSTSCRSVMYDILMWVYDNYRDEDSEDGHEIMSQTKDALLRGLGDEDIKCRLTVQNFWSSETRLPTSTLDRLVTMLEAMYSAKTEQQYLSYATNLILEMTSKSPDYQREIFEFPLSECKFSDYSVKSSWKQRHAMMTPLFATVSTQLMDMDTSVSESMDGGQLRETQDVNQFTATQDASKAPFNWLTGSSLDTFTDYSTVGTAETQSSLLFSVGTSDIAARASIRRPRLKPKSGFGKPKRPAAAGASAGKKETEDEDSEILRLKRRFLRDQEASRIFFAKRQSRLQKMREDAKREQRARRENQVTMYRKYRTGDLPDIQIKYSYIIAPLQAIAHRDSTVAKLLFSAIFKAIFAEMDQVKTEREVQETTKLISQSIDNMLATSTQYFPPLISCMLDILYDLRSNLTGDAANIGTCATVSNLQPLGITVLEEQLILHEPEDTRAAKRSRHDGMTVSQDVLPWIELARLYKSINEYDVLLGIFSGKIGTQGITQKAVEAEARGDYYQAKKLYEEAIGCKDWPGIKPLDTEIDLWDDCRMECLDNLSQWTELEEVAVSACDSGNIDKVWEDTFYQEHYLPYIIRSKVKLMLQGDTDQQSLLKFIDNSMKVPEHKSLLESRYCEELALMYLWQEDYDRARHYVAIANERFQQEWSSTDTLMLSSRVSKLQHLQPLLELQEFLDFMSHESNFTSELPAQKLLKKWERRSPHQILDPVNIWDDVITNRNVYLDHLAAKITSVKSEPTDNSEEIMDVDIEDVFLDSKLRLQLQMAESCKEQNNYKLTLQILGNTKNQCKASGSDYLLVQWCHLYASTHHKKSQGTTEWTDDTFYSILSTVDQLVKYKESDAHNEHPGLARRHNILTGQGYERLAFGLTSIESLSSLSDRSKQKISDLAGTKKTKKEELMESLVQKGYENIKKSLSHEGRSTQICRYGMDEAYIAVSNYCDRFLRLKEDEEIEISALKTFPETITVCLLNAMKLDSMEAIQRFPRLLQLVEYYPETMEMLKKKSSEVPCWMFILWISQMMALLDKPEAPAVQNIVLAIAREFPQAIVYPFKLSREGYTFGTSDQDKRNKAVIQELAELLSDERVPLISKFISALEQFGQPDQIFKDWGDDTGRLLKKKKRNGAKILEKYQEMYEQLLESGKEKTEREKVKDDDEATQSTQDSNTSSVESLSSSVEKGNYPKQFLGFKKDVEKYFGKGGKKLPDMSIRQFHEGISTVLNAMKNKDPPKVLEEYCQWMSDFNPNTDGRGLEIPGQYDGLSKPLPEYHVKIAGFDQRVLVLASIRKPKRIIIRGNDEKEYKFLVKGGEDLRQDQRIEQLFFLMNKVFDKDPACRHRKLKLRTYQVIPMTPRVGLIEWLDNTTPLKEFVYGSLTDQEAKFLKTDGPGKLQEKWLRKVGDYGKWPICYAKMYKTFSKTETVKEFKLKESKLPWDLLRRSFHQMSTSPEAFHVLRCSFAVSHALICICHYILGIGDRHLSNFMVNLKTGEMIGIDFGHAFGSATQFLPIPELMPFRLTKQIRNIMLPLQIKGLMESTMIHTLRALREDYDLLLNTMDIFVKEPSLDWLINAEKQQTTMGVEDDEAEDITWYPKEKLRYVKRKLKGENSRIITRDELHLGHQKSSAYKSYENVVMGDSSDVRTQLPDKGLTVEQQVAGLIDQATDPNLLGRVWQGWEPWV